MTKPLPHEYEATLEWAGSGAAAAGAGARMVIPVGPPPEFGGDGTHWSPEHLLLSALNGCFMATFAALARARKVSVQLYESVARASLARTEDGVDFTSFELSVTVVGAPEEQEGLRAALLQAQERCFVARALRLPVQTTFAVIPSPTPALASP